MVNSMGPNPCWLPDVHYLFIYLHSFSECESRVFCHCIIEDPQLDGWDIQSTMCAMTMCIWPQDRTIDHNNTSQGNL